MTDKHTALEAISASLWDVTSLRDFIAAVEVGAVASIPAPSCDGSGAHY